MIEPSKLKAEPPPVKLPRNARIVFSEKRRTAIFAAQKPDECDSNAD